MIKRRLVSASIKFGRYYGRLKQIKDSNSIQDRLVGSRHDSRISRSHCSKRLDRKCRIPEYIVHSIRKSFTSPIFTIAIRGVNRVNHTFCYNLHAFTPIRLSDIESNTPMLRYIYPRSGAGSVFVYNIKIAQKKLAQVNRIKYTTSDMDWCNGLVSTHCNGYEC